MEHDIWERQFQQFTHQYEEHFPQLARSCGPSTNSGPADHMDDHNDDDDDDDDKDDGQ